jgi:hypothetical protein
MAHFSGIVQLVIDVPGDDHDGELTFWEGALGQSLPKKERFPEFSGDLLPNGMGLLVQRLGDGAARVHFDIHATDVAAEVARLEALGAQVVETHPVWTVMRDPAGLLFCVVVDQQLDETNSHRWE